MALIGTEADVNVSEWSECERAGWCSADRTATSTCFLD